MKGFGVILVGEMVIEKNKINMSGSVTSDKASNKQIKQQLKKSERKFFFVNFSYYFYFNFCSNLNLHFIQ